MKKQKKYLKNLSKQQKMLNLCTNMDIVFKHKLPILIIISINFRLYPLIFVKIGIFLISLFNLHNCILHKDSKHNCMEF